MVECLKRMAASAIFLVVVVSITCHGTSADTQVGRLVPWRIERDTRRFNAVATDDVMKLLAIVPGMTILDIGAGTGQFAYEFARRLNGTGTVYATDTNKYCIDHIRKEAAGRGLNNLHPVLVKKDGVDAFYGKNKYDLITVFHLSTMTYEDQADYFRELRDSLAEGGRLILILYRTPTPFSPGDFTGDFRNMIKELSMEPAESPFSRILKDSTRKRIRDHPETEPPEELRRVIAGDFNEMLSDANLAAQIYNGSVFRKEVNFSPEERSYADWLIVPFKDNGVFRRDINIQSTSGVRTFATINKLLIMQRYRKYLKRDGLFVSGFTSSIKGAFEKAGYRLEQVYTDLIPFEDMIVFSSRSPKSGRSR